MSDEIESAHRDSGSRTLLTSALEREQNLRAELAAAVARAGAAHKEISGIRAGLSAEVAKRAEMQRKLDEAHAREESLRAHAENPPTGKRSAGDREVKPVQTERDAVERATRAEAHAAELQAMLDGLGRERAQLRSEAGALRVRVESLTSAAARARSLIEEADDLRSDAGFAAKERSHTPPPPPPVPAAAAPASSTGPVPLPRPTRK
jgi:chromosome segregation ATPase